MILADTSIWVDHIRHRDDMLVDALEHGRIIMHPLVIGELAMGDLPRRGLFLDALGNLRRAVIADHDEVLRLVNDRQLHGQGTGYVDAHLLASSMLTPDTRFWTRDVRLSAIAERLSVGQFPANR